MDIGGWLRSLGLEKYEAAFRENEIDDAVLPNLTAEDLKDLGVGIVGHRRKLLDAIVTARHLCRRATCRITSPARGGLMFLDFEGERWKLARFQRIQ